METGGFYGGQAASSGAAFDPLQFVMRPMVILKAVCWLFAIIVFGCISSQGYRLDENGRDYCIMNGNSTACSFGTLLGVVAFLASMGFLVGEYFFEQMSSVKTRKHFVMGDMAFSALWAFLYFVGFCYLTNQWGKSEDPPNGYGVNNIQASIAFAFFSIFTWAGCAYFAYMRFKAGVDPSFQSTFDATDPSANAYSSYPVTNDTEYQEPPFGGQQQAQGMNFQAAQY